MKPDFGPSLVRCPSDCFHLIFRLFFLLPNNFVRRSKRPSELVIFHNISLSALWRFQQEVIFVNIWPNSGIQVSIDMIQISWTVGYERLHGIEAATLFGDKRRFYPSIVISAPAQRSSSCLNPCICFLLHPCRGFATEIQTANTKHVIYKSSKSLTFLPNNFELSFSIKFQCITEIRKTQIWNG